MKQIDTYSYQCGVIDCFNEMVKAGMKHIALAHPCTTKENRDQTHYYLDDDPLITDLFPYSLNRNTYNIIFYKEKKYIEEYITLKERKKQSILNHQYHQSRIEIAYAFGHLLSYSDSIIEQYIQTNNEKEDDEGKIIFSQ